MKDSIKEKRRGHTAVRLRIWGKGRSASDSWRLLRCVARRSALTYSSLLNTKGKGGVVGEP
jgi:hypothetical protein